MKIQVLGTGCMKCNKLYAEVEKAIAQAGVSVELSKVEKIEEIVQNLFVENIEVRTDDDPDVREYVQEVKVKWHQVVFPEEFRRITQTHQTRHLSGCGGQIRTGIFHLGQIIPAAILLNIRSGKMIVKVSPGISRIQFRICTAVDLCEETFRSNDTGGHHEGLVPVIT